MAAASAAELQPVANVKGRLRALLDRARRVKLDTTVEPPLSTSKLGTEIETLHDDLEESVDDAWTFGIHENAAREIFYPLVGSTDIHDPAFVDVWNLLDILLLCGDRSKCAPELACQLIEELLDSQTTDKCRTVFDYLESRRERVAAKDFHKKNLILLRACNELLKRLSRAEDAVFCGRVFFFLFQTFPLGDKSSVNLRGEFHVEYTTKFEVLEAKTRANGEQMEIDAEPARAENPKPLAKSGSNAVPNRAPKKAPEEEMLTNSELYPIFWRLQQDFTDPTRLFAPDVFQNFKKGLASTMSKFKKTPTVLQTKAAESTKRGVKRNFEGNGINGELNEHFVDNYNPKYLTSRELFDLELSDLAFQRHIIVQALILIDFLISLTDKAKKKIAALEADFRVKSQETQERSSLNKSLLYSFTLSKEDTEWATATRTSIKAYLVSTGNDGRMFDRMVDTVLARDKNWVRWKLEACPSIVRDPVSTEQEVEARKGARDATRLRRIPDKIPGAIDLSFLDEGGVGGLESLKKPARFTAPTIDQLLVDIKAENLDLELAMDDEEKGSLENAISNKTWRALRQARANNLNLLDKVEPGKDLEDVFRPAEPHTEPGEQTSADGEAPAVVITDGEGEHPPAMDSRAIGETLPVS